MSSKILLAAAEKGIHLYLNDGQLAFKAPAGALDEDLKMQIIANKPAIIEYLLTQQSFSHNAVNNIPSVSRGVSELPLSYAQQRLWLLDKIEQIGTQYNIASALKLKGKLDVEALKEAFKTIIDRHESLRTCFVTNKHGQPLQIVQENVQLLMPILDLSDTQCDEKESLISKLIDDEAELAFDLTQDLMLRVQLVKLADDEHMVLVTMHHIASDGWSMAILINEFCELYGAYTNGGANPLEPLPIQYADYAYWQRNWLTGDVLKEQLDYWSCQLASIPEVHGLPLDHPRPAEQVFDGGSIAWSINKDTFGRLKAICQEHGATLFMGLHALFSLFLSRYSNETDIVMGSPIANREQKDVAGLIGFFVNTLVLRSDLSLNPSFSELIAQSKTMLLSAYAHQQVPFEQIVERLQPTRSLRHSPLFQIMLILQNNEEGELDLPELTLSSLESDNQMAKYELTLSAAESDQGLSLDWQYNTALFNESTIVQMASNFNVLLESVLKSPQSPALGLPILTEKEHMQNLIGWNNTFSDYPKSQCIHQLIEAQVKQNGEAVAVVFGDKQLSYAQLNRRANQLAHFLVEKAQVRPDSLVGICLERSIDMVVSILAIIKAGGAYVPLDPQYPETRLRYMLDDAKLGTILTHQYLLSSTPIAKAQACCLDDEILLAKLDEYSTENLCVSSLGLTSSNLAYVIYTSGSTGNPKGVMIEHHSLVNRVDWMDKQYGCTPEDNILQKTPFSFDVSVWEFVWPLSKGAGLILAKPEGHKDPEYLTELIQNTQVSKLHFVPSMLESMLSLGELASCTSLKQVFCSGEALSLHHTVSFANSCPHAELHNLYGPTEASIDVSYWDCAELTGTHTSIPIGKPIHNTQLYVLNSQLSPVPIGAPGELYIGGVGLARGYLNRDELTAERFIENPFYDENIAGSSQRLYKTGDLVRWLPDGNLVFLGRLDHQVKLRGFRIELGEIEHTIGGLENVRDVVVIARSDNGQHEQQLVAYVVEEAAAEISDKDKVVTQLRQHVEAVLPDYMVPSAFVVMESLPLTPNGKVDRKALPAPDFSQQQESYVAPSTETERLLCAIWQDVLGIEQVGVKDNFFALGGHSLLVIQVIARLQEIGKSISAKVLFSAKTLSDVAAAIDASVVAETFKVPANEIPENCEHITPEMLPLVDLDEQSLEYIVNQVPGGAGNIQDIYPLGPLQKGILFHHMMSEQGDPYVLPALFKVNGKTNLASFKAALEFVIGRHDVLRTAILWEGLPTPVQVVYKEAVLRIEEVAVEAGMDVMDIMSAKSAPESQSMDLSQGPLIQLQVAAMDDDAFIVLLQYHHIISDHVGLEIIQSEIAAYMQGKADTLLPSKAFRGFVAHALHQEKNNDAHAYFESLLGDVEEPTAPFNLLDVQGDGSQIVELRAQVRPALSSKLREVAKRLAVSPAAIFHAAWSLLISGCSGRDDVVFGTVVSGRLQGTMGAESMLGVFINTLPFRVKLQGVTALELVEQVQERLVSLLPYEQTSLAEAQKCSGLPGGTPLFSALLNYRHSGQEVDDTEPLAPEEIELIGGQERTNYPFDMSVDDLGVEFELEMQADPSVNVERIIGYMQTALENLVVSLDSAPETAVNQLSILPEAERKKLLAQSLGPCRDYAGPVCIHERFEAQVASTPLAVAVVHHEQSMTYTQLNKQANQLAHYLNAQGVGANDLVGIYAERSPAFLVGMLAVMKAGGAYVPLDPVSPKERIENMVTNAQLRVLLSDREQIQEIEISEDIHVVYFDDLADGFSKWQTDNPVHDSSGDDYAYMIYTSGSTGQPKGALVHHSGAMNHIDAEFDVLGFMNEDMTLKPSNFLQSAASSSDVSVWQFLAPVLSGGTTVILDDMTDMESLVSLVQQHDVHLIETAPVVLQLLVNYAKGLPEEQKALPLRWVMSIAEAVPVKLVNEWLELYPDIPIMNGYGPSEASDDISEYIISAPLAPDTPSVPIGRPLPNLSLYVLGSDLQLQPEGAVGEICVAGVGVGPGYWKNEEKTAESFVANPYGQEKGHGARLYRTGDLGRWLPDGNLAFLGRIDNQVKVRGFRVELGEIEAALSSVSGIGDVAVLVRQDNRGENVLAAYLVSQVEPRLSNSEIREALLSKLPEYMIPTSVTWLDKMPLNAADKIDRHALPAPDRSSQQEEYIAPRTDTEILLCQIWQEVLGVEQVGISDNFFALGGHSLLVIQVISKLQVAGKHLSARELFAARNLSAVATMIDSSVMTEATEFVVPANLIPVGSKTITPDMLPLVNLEQSEIDHIANEVPGGAGNIQDIYPLGPLQEGILFHHMVDASKDPYVLPALFKVRSKEKLDLFIDALQYVIGRHDVLRTAIFWENLSRPVQVVYREANLKVEWIEIDASLDLMAQMEALSAPGAQSINLSDGPLIQMQVAKSEQDEFAVLLKYHHIISDHVGLEIIQDEVRAFMEDDTARLLPARPFREFVAHTLHHVDTNCSQVYFKSLLEGIEEPTAPFNLLDVKGDGSAVLEAKERVPKTISVKLREVARKLEMSPAAIFHAAWSLLISGCSGRDDVVFGTVVSGRLQGTMGAESMLGVFINTLPFRVKLQGVTALELAKQVQERLVSLLPYEQTSLAEAQRGSNLPSGTPLFSALFNYRHTTYEESDSHSDNTDDYIELIGGQERTNYPFDMSVDDLGVEFELEMQADPSVNVERIIGYMQTALENLVVSLDSAPETAVNQLSILPEAERKKLLAQSLGPCRDYAGPVCIHERFEAQVASTPLAVAVVHHEQSMTYTQLNKQANQLAHYLNAQGVGANDLVGIYAERSPAFLVGMLAVMKAGGAYVPLDPVSPKERIENMVTNAQLRVLLSDREQIQEIEISEDIHVVYFDDLADGFSKWQTDNPVHDSSGDDYAYMIYTSGSTGQPKGALVHHSGAMNHIDAEFDVLGFMNEDMTLKPSNFLQSAASSSDVSVWQFLAPVLSGGTTVILDDMTDMESLVSLVQQHDVHLIETAPVVLQLLVNYAKGLPEEQKALPLRWVMSIAEAVPVKLVNEWLELYPDIPIMNGYGPSEASDDISEYIISAPLAPDTPSVPIGRPLPNLSLYVLGSDLQLQPEGAVGEICVAGVGVGPGYWKNEEKTAESFVANPYGQEKGHGARLYRTGDLGRWLPDGNLAFLGRIDNQVKVRGFRVELGEIEAALSSVSGIGDVAVLVRQDNRGENVLAAYLVSQVEPRLSNSEIREALLSKLPEYMIPTSVTWLDKMPLNAADKIDRHALPAPDRSSQQEEYIAPRTDTEILLCQIWQEVLGVEQVGISDNFFALGGHSLTVMDFIITVKKRTGCTLPIALVYGVGTIEHIADELDLIQLQQEAQERIAGQVNVEEMEI
ncbi:hypothetical protein PA25_12260 [Pseudoalteromonas sp. A25]|uniref:non-ribosomal peptide synthetase n=1 Tax=Pseudoalteromonas sp. A25 TaxID=116092 RepID=UPI0012611474|nr:non-ribosomal peptide synthetase [Pseudoalteromonas sp. A25]BBN81241.1 hypothetical protein PA25_12260 [Pseudoalteromonas sp. A25]